MKHGFKSWAEREAIHLRRQESLAPWDPLPSEFLAKRLNSVIIGPREVAGLSKAQLDVLLDGCASEWSAVTVQTELGGHVIIENTSHSPKRRETTRFHEMAHIIRGHRPTGICLDSWRRDAPTFFPIRNKRKRPILARRAACSFQSFGPRLVP